MSVPGGRQRGRTPWIIAGWRVSLVDNNLKPSSTDMKRGTTLDICSGYLPKWSSVYWTAMTTPRANCYR